MTHARSSWMITSILLSLAVGCGGPAATTTTTTEEETSGEESAERSELPLDELVAVPGTGIRLRAPRGSDLLPTGAGFVHARRRLQVLVAETQGPDDQLEAFRTQLIEGAEEEVEPITIEFSGGEATLGVDRQTSGEMELERVWLFARSGDRAVAVIGAYLAERSERYRELVTASVRSAEWNREIPIDAEQALGFALSPEGLVLDRGSSSPVVYTLPGAAVPPSPAEPRLFVMSIPVAVPAAQRVEVCEEILFQAGPVSEENARTRGEIETDELEGCEVEGLQENASPEEGEPDAAMTYAAIVFHDDGTFMVAGIVDEAERDTWLERFQAATRTLRRVREEADAPWARADRSAMHVVLIHGMGRTPRSMARLSRRLNEAGHSTSSFGYGVRTSSIDQLSQRFARELSAIHQPYAVIGHSLGNILYRLAEPSLERLPQQIAMLAPPNNAAAIARLVSSLPLAGNVFRLLTGDAGRRLTDPAFFLSIPQPRANTIVFAGDAGPRMKLPFDGQPNDGIVAVQETRLSGIEHEVVPAIHTFIMNHPRVVRRITDRLR